MYIVKLGSGTSYIGSWGYTLLRENAKRYKTERGAKIAIGMWKKKYGYVYEQRAKRDGRTFNYRVVEVMEVE